MVIFSKIYEAGSLTDPKKYTGVKLFSWER